MTRLLSSLLAATDAPPFAVIHREHEPTLDVLVGPVIHLDRLADVPLGERRASPSSPSARCVSAGSTAGRRDADPVAAKCQGTSIAVTRPFGCRRDIRWSSTTAAST